MKSTESLAGVQTHTSSLENIKINKEKKIVILNQYQCWIPVNIAVFLF